MTPRFWKYLITACNGSAFRLVAESDRDPDDRSPKPLLVFRPEKLRELGVPEALIEAAANSKPQGVVLFEDLLDQIPSPSNGSADQPTKRR